MYEIQYILLKGLGERIPKIERLEAASKKSACILIRSRNYRIDSRGRIIQKVEIINVERV